MSLDIRVPIGLLFATLGGLLALYGVVTSFSDPAMYDRSLGINVNLWWGVVMFAFGVFMISMGSRGSKAAGPSEIP